MLSIYRFFFLKKSMYKISKYIFRLSLRGIGVLNFENNKVSGEYFFLKKVFRNHFNDDIVVFDVGAFIGEYATMIKQFNKNANVYAFEPSPGNYSRLIETGEKEKFYAVNAACGESAGMVKFYDYENEVGSQHASLYRDAIEKVHKGGVSEYEVNMITLDEFVKGKNIRKIFLLKIDTEGNEMKVLTGARNIISNGLVDIIHFEFNEMNVLSRTFFKDFYDLLSSDFNLYRLLPYGFVSLDDYEIFFCEIFAYQNIVAMRKGMKI